MPGVLNQPYPYYNSQPKMLKNSFAILSVVFLFLFFFTPFNVNRAEHKYGYMFICFIHALNAALVYTLFFTALNTLAAGWVKEEGWKVYKAIVALSALMLLIGLGSFLLRDLIYDNPDNFSWKYFFKETINTFLAGSLVFGVFTLLDFYRLIKNNRINASGLQEDIEEHKKQVEKHEKIEILAENDLMLFDSTEILFIKAEGNYVEFYTKSDNTVTKTLKRISLKKVDEQLIAQTKNVIRVHRAWLVNAEHIKKVEGNAQGYQLFFERTDIVVPVSRSYINSFKAVMKSISQ